MSSIDLSAQIGQTRPRGAVRRMRRLSLFTRILLSNAMIVVIGAVAGTWLTSIIVRRAPTDAMFPLAGGFAVIGIVLSLLVNVVVLRRALAPLVELRRAAQAVRSGDMSARAPISVEADAEMTDLAETLNATLDELARDHAELRSLSSQVIRAQEEERRRIARELHDDTAQLLFAQLLRVTALKASRNEELRQMGEELELGTVEALEGVRRLALELRPPALDDLGLAEALAGLAQRFQVQSRIEIDYEMRGSRSRLSPDVELVLYRVAQEALTNIAKHAKASRVSMDLDRGVDDVSLSVRDDGIGFDPSRQIARAATGIGLGLFGMQERVTLVGGALRLWSDVDSGTEVFAYLPIEPRRLAAGTPERLR